jgi:hypothetical protein
MLNLNINYDGSLTFAYGRRAYHSLPILHINSEPQLSIDAIIEDIKAHPPANNRENRPKIGCKRDDVT